jgi:hypothetical protein
VGLAAITEAKQEIWTKTQSSKATRKVLKLAGRRRASILDILPGALNHEPIFGGIVGRRERIQTSGPLVPNVKFEIKTAGTLSFERLRRTNG